MKAIYSRCGVWTSKPCKSRRQTQVCGTCPTCPSQAIGANDYESPRTETLKHAYLCALVSISSFQVRAPQYRHGSTVANANIILLASNWRSWTSVREVKCRDMHHVSVHCYQHKQEANREAQLAFC
eukprot:1758644-Amphidinium_carterae.1